MFAYNTSRHETTHFIPFEVMFGQCATLPIDVNIQEQFQNKAPGVHTHDEIKESEFEDMTEKRMKL